MISTRPSCAANRPIAIIGMGCRFPGHVVDVDSLWQLLIEERSAVTTVPDDRWNSERYYHENPTATGRMITRRGGFVDQLKQFDAAFWGISPREAMRLDPQQRWLLETSWEAIEDAGLAPSTLRGEEIGVFVGAASHDYGTLQLNDLANLDVHTNSGGTLSIAANRISYQFDFRGPSLAVDTACSSSLVAVSMACRSLWAGECKAALAGGVNALITPNTSIGFSKASMLSPDGECYAFDQRANGYVRAEGAGMILLKPLEEAIEDRDPIYAVIRAAVINQDGHTSSMTVPSVDGQAAMLRMAYAEAGVVPSQVAYVETHGTGTPVGDPIEAKALGTVLSSGRTNQHCLLGSIKTNLGHLESASGIAGLFKAALVVAHQTIPPNTNFVTPNASIPFDDLKLRVADKLQPLPRITDGSPVASVNSFGFGGTNAHVVLEAPPDQVPATLSRDLDRPLLLPISARDDASLRENVRQYIKLLPDMDAQLADFCYSAGARHEHHDRRLVAVGKDARQLRKQLRVWLDTSDKADGIVVGDAPDQHDSTVFVFTGQGSQWLGMGTQLLSHEPIVRETLAEIDGHFQPLSGWSLVDALQAADETSHIDRTSVCQPAIFALQVALVRLWESWGISADTVVGHSVGEIAAAWCAGIYSIEDAVRLIYHRSALQDTTGGSGRMLVAGITADEARDAIGELAERVQVTAINSPVLVTLGGDTEALVAIGEKLESAGKFVRWLKIKYAFHTHQMDAIQDELLDRLAFLNPQAGRIPFLSTVTGQACPGEQLDAAYWWRNVRQPVLFEPAVSELISAGHRHFLEVGPHPSLKSSLEACLATRNAPGRVFHSLKRDADESVEMAENAARMYLAGKKLCWPAVNQSPGNFVRQPRYSWNYQEYWLDEGDTKSRTAAPLHPLLGERLNTAQPVWQVKLDASVFPYLNDHRIWDSIVFPAAGYVEIGLAVSRALFPDRHFSVEDLESKKALFLSEDDPTTMQVAYDEELNSFSVFTSNDDEHWELHARGRLVARATPPRADTLDLNSLRAGLRESIDQTHLYDELRGCGYGFGDCFSLIEQMSIYAKPAAEDGGADEGTAASFCIAVAEVLTPQHLATTANDYCVHPAVLDACFQATHGARCDTSVDEQTDSFFLPESIRRVQLYADQLPVKLLAIAVPKRRDRNSLSCDIIVCDERGNRLADVLDFKVTRVEHQPRPDRVENCLYRFQWEQRRLPGTGVAGSCEFPATNDLISAVESHLPELYESRGLHDYYQQFAPRIEQIVHQFIQNACLHLGWTYCPGAHFTFEEFVRDLNIADDHHRLAGAELVWLETAGILSRTSTGWRVERLPTQTDVSGDLDSLIDEFPQFAAEARLVQITGPRLADVLRGDANPLELLFPGGSSLLLEEFYTQAGEFPVFNGLVRTAIERLVDTLPNRRVLRILEIGGGTGSVTREILDVLPEGRAEYLFTDIGPAFVAAAEKHFADLACVTFSSLDIERPLEEQGIEPGQFDLVVASNVLHATQDLQTTLNHVRSALAPSGMLMFVEVVKRRPVWDNVFGMLNGWWRFNDLDTRDGSPLLDRQQWTSLLLENGFEDTGSFTGSPLKDEFEQAVFVARTSCEPRVRRDQSRAAGRYLLFADKGGVADSLASQLESDGGSVILLRRGSEFRQVSDSELLLVDGSSDELLHVFEHATRDRREIEGIIHCWSLDGVTGSQLEEDSDGVHPLDGCAEVLETQSAGVLSGLQLAHSLQQSSWSTPPRVYFVTRDAQTCTEDDFQTGFPSAPLVGFCRVANGELTQFKWTTIDLETGTFEADDLASEIRLASDEREVAFRDGRRLVNRLQRVRLDDIPERRRDAVQADGSIAPYRVQMAKAGVLADLSLNEMIRREPGPDEIEVRVMAGGINFRDVMKALDMYPGPPEELLWFGDDFAGVIERVGVDVTSLRPGDRVTGIAPYCFQSHVTVDHRMVFKTANDMTFEAAATLPTVFLTTHFAIRQIARMQPGEKILIHAGTGGIGQAAIQVAQQCGLEVFATAGTPEKRGLLRTMGVRHVMNSRTLDFADEVMHLTGGKGVDAVLNSLAGEFVPKSLSVLAPFGRFLEIGKVDIYGNSKVGLAAFKNNISYHVIDLAQVIVERPEVVAEIFEELNARFVAGQYRPLMHKVYPVTDVAEAFRYMAQGQHVGKNVLSFDYPAYGCQERESTFSEDSTPLHIPIGPCTQMGQMFRADATYLVTGGAGGFGLEVAKWMADQGARHLVLMSRSGPNDEATADIETLRAGGTNVVDTRGDVTCYADVARVIEEIASTCPPLKGVIHGAMVLDDEFITDLDEERFNRALHPKILGAWNLHATTRSLPLEHFVCFSSFSAIVGAPRQSNYNAGNCFLDALAQYRRRRGLPALTVNWGAVLGAGFVARNRKTKEYLHNIGLQAFQMDEALGMLQELMKRDVPLISAGRVDWKQLGRLSPVVGKSPLFSEVIQDQASSNSTQSLRNRLATASVDEQPGILEDQLAIEVAGVFGIPVSHVDRTAPLTTLGIDSLMAVELMNRIETATGANVPMSCVLSGPSIQQLSHTLLELIDHDDHASGEGSDPPQSSTAIDYDAEAQLEVDVRPARQFVRQTQSSRLFVTGATGFLGAYLLRELLETTQSELTCLVRAVDQPHGMHRLRDNMSKYGLDSSGIESRIRVVPGDFSQQRFGLSSEEYDRLANRVDAIYHNGADVNLLLPYESLRSANVTGTREILRLACHGRTKPTHFVSTFTVFTTEANRGKVVAEMDTLPPCEELLYGYSQTKWVGEKLAQQFRQRGGPVTIYRPGHITGDSNTGATNVDDLLHTIVLACLRMGAAPFEEVELDVTPVNYVAKAIVALSQQPESIGKDFHLTNPQPLTTQVLIEWMRRSDVSVELIGYDEWRTRLRQLAEQVGVSLEEFGPLADMLLPKVSHRDNRGLHPCFDSSLTQQALAKTGIRCPAADNQLLETGHAFLRRVGSAPPEQAPTVRRAA